ncbi:MAG: hypothetical protein GY832_00735 [Chloroflexi bacterium]|nr:hypothetical protein [Chloroflexota bacterium]
MNYQVFYCRRIPFTVDDSFSFLPPRTHAFIRQTESESLDDLYREMQGCVWSPNGEARDLVARAGVYHTSMSVGDVAVDANGRAWLCANRGWIELDDADHNPVLITKNGRGVCAESERQLTEMEQHALAACGFLIPMNSTVTMLEFASMIEAGYDNDKTDALVAHLRECKPQMRG